MGLDELKELIDAGDWQGIARLVASDPTGTFAAITMRKLGKERMRTLELMAKAANDQVAVMGIEEDPWSPDNLILKAVAQAKKED